VAANVLETEYPVTPAYVALQVAVVLGLTSAIVFGRLASRARESG
jgi:hypothetical protein